MKATSIALALSMSLITIRGYALPSESQIDTNYVSSSPFHDCIDTGKTFDDCRAFSRLNFQPMELKRRNTPSSSPFHDCMEQEGAVWADCAAAARLVTRTIDADSHEGRDIDTNDAGSRLAARKLPSVIQGIVKGINETFMGSFEQCYSIDNVGKAGWLTNTVVRSLKTEACTYAVQQAFVTGIGKYKTTKSGFYQDDAGPIVSPKVQFFLSIALMGIDIINLKKINDIQAFAIDLCVQGVDHLVSDKGCTSKRKVLNIITSHTSVNGGEYDWALAPIQDPNTALNQDINEATPTFESGFGCKNCMMSMIMEAANKISKDGKTATPVDP